MRQPSYGRDTQLVVKTILVFGLVATVLAVLADSRLLIPIFFSTAAMSCFVLIYLSVRSAK